MPWNSSMYFMYFLLFMSFWILLPPVPSPTLCILIFLLCFLFGLVLSALHLKTTFSLIGTRGASLSLAVLFSAPFLLWSPFCLCSVSLLFPSLISLLLFFFLCSPSWCFLLILPAKLAEALPWEGADKQQLGCLQGYIGRDTYKGILWLSRYIVDWSDSSSSF